MTDDLVRIPVRPWRRLGAAVLWRALLDAAKGDDQAERYITGAESAALAEWLDLARWPPLPELRTLPALKAARARARAVDDLGGVTC